MNKYEKINELHKMLNSGNITQQEFASLKQTLLNEHDLAVSMKSKNKHDTIKIWKRISLVFITITFVVIGGYTEFTENLSFEMGLDENIGRTAVKGLVSGSIALVLAVIGMSIGSAFGVVGVFVGALFLGSLGCFGLPIGGHASDAIWGDKGAHAGSGVRGSQYDVSKIR